MQLFIRLQTVLLLHPVCLAANQFAFLVADMVPESYFAAPVVQVMVHAVLVSCYQLYGCLCVDGIFSAVGFLKEVIDDLQHACHCSEVVGCEVCCCLFEFSHL